MILFLALTLIITALLCIRPQIQAQAGGGGNEITERYFAKYYIKVLIDYLDSKIPGQIQVDNDMVKNLYQQSNKTTIVLPLIKQLQSDFPTIEIKSSRVNGNHYFYQISNSLDIRRYYRKPIVSTFKPILYIKTSGKIDYAGFLDVPQFKKLSGPDSCTIGYSTQNIGNRIVSTKSTIKKQLKHRSKNKFHGITSSCIDKSTGEEVELNEIDCILTGFSWDQPKYYEIDFTK